MNSPIRMAICVISFNRIKSLDRLMRSLRSLKVSRECEIDLILSIDKSDIQEYMFEKCKEFVWEHGDKIIIKHKNNLGIKNHVFSAADHVFGYDILVMLEEDIVISPLIIEYFAKSYQFIKNNGGDRIAGISSYTYSFNETSKTSFFPLFTCDNHYIQIPSSWGQAWTPSMWFDFKEWINKKNYKKNENNLPYNVLKWPDSSWKRVFYSYLIDKDMFFFYPNISYSTNPGDAGENMKKNDMFQVRMNIGDTVPSNFRKLFSAPSYDHFMEIRKEFIKKYIEFSDDFSVNIHGSKIIGKESAQLSRIKRKTVFLSWDGGYIPPEFSIMRNINGDGIYLCKGRVDFSIKNMFNYLGIKLWPFKSKIYILLLYFRNVFGKIFLNK